MSYLLFLAFSGFIQVSADVSEDTEWHNHEWITIDTSESARELIEVLGSTTSEVPVYVQVNHESPHLLCMTHQLRSRELIDPNAIWTTPHESDLEGGRVFTKSSGTLVIANFTQNLSGLYSCNLRYIDPTIYTEREIVLRFMVYAYQESFLSFELSLRYHMGTCIDTFKRAFTEGLSKILNELVLDLSCDVSILHSECHIIELPQGGLQHQLYIKMKVSDLSPLSSVSCSGMNTCYRNERVIEAKNMINEFFFTQEEAIEQSTEELPMFYYIGGTLTVESVYHCFPGFGVDQEKHPRCPDCCVVCSPGTYSSSSGSSCEPCASSVAYGEQNCL